MERYNRIAIGLHWLIAGFILALVPIGLLMEDAPKAIQVTVYQMHKSFGLMVLFLSLARLGWRFINPPPSLPDTMKPWEKLSAHGVHIVFYVLIIAIPLSGWMMVSSSPKNIPTMFLTLFHWPHIWFLAQMAVEQKKAIVGTFHEVHEILAFGTIGLMLLHIGAALKHQYIDKDNEMARMIPALGKTTPPARKPRGVLLVFGGPIVLFVLIALMGNPSSVTATPIQDTTSNEAFGNWVLEPQNSHLGFSFTYAGSAVEGEFTRWNAEILLDPNNLSAAHILINIDLASAKTGDVSYDNTMREADWFDVSSLSHAVFESRNVRKDGDDAYRMEGTLSLRGLELPLSIGFGLDIEGDEAFAQGMAPLDRLAFGVGANTDPGATTVSKMVQINFRVKAKHRATP